MSKEMKIKTLRSERDRIECMKIKSSGRRRGKSGDTLIGKRKFIPIYMSNTNFAK